MSFEIFLQNGHKRYRLEVTTTFADDWKEEYTVVAGSKEIVFRNNRPEMRRLEKKGRLKWQLVSKNFKVAEKDIQKAADFLLRIQNAIEEYVEPLPNFQQIRNKHQH